jgi:hypothetical protein
LERFILCSDSFGCAAGDVSTVKRPLLCGYRSAAASVSRCRHIHSSPRFGHLWPQILMHQVLLESCASWTMRVTWWTDIHVPGGARMLNELSRALGVRMKIESQYVGARVGKSSHTAESGWGWEGITAFEMPHFIGYCSDNETPARNPSKGFCTLPHRRVMFIFDTAIDPKFFCHCYYMLRVL